MDIETNYGKAVLFDSKIARIKNLRKTLYNAGSGIEEMHQSKGMQMVPWLVSLTYADIDAWRPDHLSSFLTHCRNHFKRKTGFDLSYVWVAELQKRGAVHYHIVFWLTPGFKFPKFARSGWWKHGFTDQKIAKKSFGYLMKYISKDTSKYNFPKNCRIYGFGGVDTLTRQKIRFYRASQSVRSEVTQTGLTYKDVDIRPYPGGGRYCKLTGWFFESRWKMTICNGRVVFYLLNDDEEYDTNMLVDINSKLPYYIDIEKQLKELK